MAFQPDRPYNELPPLPPPSGRGNAGRPQELYPGACGNLVEAGIAQRQSASVRLKRLCDIGVLEERKAGREKLFINPALLRLLTPTAA